MLEFGSPGGCAEKDLSGVIAGFGHRSSSSLRVQTRSPTPFGRELRVTPSLKLATNVGKGASECAVQFGAG